MFNYTAKGAPRSGRLSFSFALAITLAMAIVYTVHDTLQMREPFFSLVSFLPGVLSIGALLASGFTREACGLTVHPFSISGIAALALAFLLLVPILLSGTSVRWDPLAPLVYAPASGFAQELYFRSALLPALVKRWGGHRWPALVLHGLIFVAYHWRTFSSIGAIGPSVAVGMVLFLAGLAWGWESQRDRTVLWTVVQHSIFLAAMSLYTWG
jgi:hypothetical protein